jgi:hypothetical protein
LSAQYDRTEVTSPKMTWPALSAISVIVIGMTTLARTAPQIANATSMARVGTEIPLRPFTRRVDSMVMLLYPEIGIFRLRGWLRTVRTERRR